MAAACQGLLRPQIIKSSSCLHNKVLKLFDLNRFQARGLANKSEENKNEGTSDEQSTHVDESPQKPWFLQPIPKELRGDHLPNPVRNTEREFFQWASDPNRKHIFEGKYYTRKRGITREAMNWLQWSFNINDDDVINEMLKRREYNQHKLDQRFLEERVKAVGVELGAAHFLIVRGGAVKFVGRDQWFVKDKEGRSSVPKTFVNDLFIEAIDASNMDLTYVAFDNLELSQLRYLRLKNCRYIDDWCLSRLQRLKNSLEFLDISDCPGITDNGLSSLHVLKNIKGLRLSNLENVKHLGLLTLLLEESIPGLKVLGVKDEDLMPPSWENRGERRLVRALLGYLDEDKEGDGIGKVEDPPMPDSPDFDNIHKKIVRIVE